MPPRWLSLAIILFWLSVMGPLLYRQVTERLEGDNEPPGFTIDLVDEAQRGPAEIQWDVRHSSERYQGEDRYLGKSSVIPQPRGEVFDLRLRLDRIVPEAGRKPLDSPWRIITLDSSHTVTRTGQLRGTRFKTRLMVIVAQLAQECNCEFVGEVRGDDQFYSTLSITSAGQDIFRQFDPVPFTRKDSILNPLHPVKRIMGLQPGRKWTIPELDPIRNVLPEFPGQDSGSASSRLNGCVLPELQTLRWDRNRDLDCLIVEHSRSGEVVARTWVEQKTGLVLKQEARRNGDIWEFLRISEIDES
jgi:hypothetical protein